MRLPWSLFLMLCLAVSFVYADGPADNLAEKVRPVPPPGIALPPAERAELEVGVTELGKEIEALRTTLQAKPALLDLLPDVQIYHKAVHVALAYNEFFNAREIRIAKTLLQQGRERAGLLGEGKAPWTTATGLIVRGYRSRMDDSVQPYGLVVPASYQANAAHAHRLDLWFHGRGETLSELNFIDGRQRSPGEFTPAHAFVLHLYGRYCNGSRFAGEVDLFEALEHVRQRYPIDENRLVVRGFSLGGAACWHIATHHAGLWAAAAPGAGFSETADFLKVFQKETIKPTWYEEKLWHLYDATDYAVNLVQCPTVAYSGEIDKQKQAADKMAEALAAEGGTLVHILGPKTAHRYEPHAKEEINRRLDRIAQLGRDPLPRHIRFTTWTLRYNQMRWITVDALQKHWERARVDAEIAGANTVNVATENIAALTLAMPAGSCPLDPLHPPKVILDGQELTAAPVLSDRSWTVHFRKDKDRWAMAAAADDATLRKRHGLQGPIDDAFMDRFLMVRPTGTPWNDKVAAWANAEMAHALTHWRKQFRGEARIKDDSAITADDLARSNLVLWGDPASNKVLAKIADRLPIRWDREAIQLASTSFSSAHHVPVLVYPNPLNPRRYVVLNSGFTFREYDYLNNARQVPKLPDYALVDVNVPASSRAPGAIVAAGFFGEAWELPAGRAAP